MLRQTPTPHGRVENMLGTETHCLRESRGTGRQARKPRSIGERQHEVGEARSGAVLSGHAGLDSGAILLVVGRGIGRTD